MEASATWQRLPSGHLALEDLGSEFGFVICSYAAAEESLRLRVLIDTMEMVTTAISINRFLQRTNRDNAQAQSKTVNKDSVCFFPLNWNQGYILRSDTHGNHGVDQHMLENAKSQSSWLWHFLDTRRGTLEDSSGLAWANSNETDFSPKAIK